MMNPLSPLTYYRRHKRRALLMLSLIALTTLGVCVMVRLLDAFPEQTQVAYRYLTRFSLLHSPEPGVVSQVRAHPDVAHVIPERNLYVHVPLSSIHMQGFRVLGVAEADLPVLMETCDLRLKEGRLPKARTNEIVLSGEIASALGLRIGDRIGRSVDEGYTMAIPTELVLVGLLENDPESDRILLGFVSYEYLDSHESYASRPINLIVVATRGRKEAVDSFLEMLVGSSPLSVSTYRQHIQILAQGMLYLHLIFGVVDCLVALVIALVVGTINKFGLTQRLAEFGLLNAVGYGTKKMIRRLTLETAGVAGMGWVIGLALSWLFFAWLKINVCPPTMELNLTNVTPIWFAAPIPLAVVAFAALSITRTFARFDAVTIIERGRLGAEIGSRKQMTRRFSAKPLSAWTFYLRHKGRGLALVIVMGLATLGVAFPVFLLAPMVEAETHFTEYLRRVSVVWPIAGDAVAPEVVAQIRGHPGVAHVIPAIELSLTVDVPPVNFTQASVYGVSKDDIQVLTDLYGVQLTEGRLPRPRTNEIVVSQAMAQNRELRVGDRVGQTVYEQDMIPTEMVVVGILSTPQHDPQADDIWLGFASYEYLEGHERYASWGVQLLVVPVEGHKAELDAWLEEKVASTRTLVKTYDARLRDMQQATRSLLLLFAAVESVVAVVAAIALTVLSYTFITERREEFGILHAMGWGRRWLVLRTAGETASAVAVAWLIGAALCGVGLIYMQMSLYAPKGLSLDFFNPAPWLFTLPIPLAVVAASAGTIAWMFSKLDPVSIIERR